MNNPAATIQCGTHNLHNATELKRIITDITADYTFIYTQPGSIEWNQYGRERMLQVARDTGAGMVYSDYYSIEEDRIQQHANLDYQPGSIRDDFNFGPVALYKTAVLKQAVSKINNALQYAALYALRLNASLMSDFVHISELLYTLPGHSRAIGGYSHFAYVDPKNREVQLEMETVCTQYLKETKAYLKPEFEEVNIWASDFAIEASVIIPVKNRKKTIKQAVLSALEQETSFPFNVIVIDNFSTDGTSNILKELNEKYEQLVVVLPQTSDLGIGGCWNEGIMHPRCGRFAVQLDSDDLYIDKTVLQQIVEEFHEQQCPMLVGSYKIVDFDLNEIPPGIIDHREWTAENGRNNLLRINGLGAPRAYYTPLIREIKFPNVCYGEDYFMGLAISHRYRIGRIYNPLYLCRRWEGNTDSGIDLDRLNRYNRYKDSLRTQEMMKRMNSK